MLYQIKLIIFIILIFLCSCIQPKINYKFEAQKAFEENRYAEAINFYNKAIDNDFYNIELYFERAKIYSIIEDFNNAIQDYSKIISMNPKSIEAHKLRGEIFLRKKLIDQAISDFEAMLKMDHRNIDAMIYLSQIYISRQMYRGATSYFYKMIKIEPKNPDFYLYQLYSNFLISSRHLSKAQNILKGRTHLFKEDKIYSRLIDILLNNIEFDIKYFQDIEDDKMNSKIFTSIGFYFLFNKQNESARDYFQKAVDINLNQSMEYHFAKNQLKILISN